MPPYSWVDSVAYASNGVLNEMIIENMNMKYLLGWWKCWCVQRNSDWSIILYHNIHVSSKHATCVAVVTVGGADLLHLPLIASGLYCCPNCAMNCLYIGSDISPVIAL